MWNEENLPKAIIKKLLNEIFEVNQEANERKVEEFAEVANQTKKTLQDLTVLIYLKSLALDSSKWFMNSYRLYIVFILHKVRKTHDDWMLVMLNWFIQIVCY